MSLRAAYEADMAFAINNAKKHCRKFFAGEGPWLGPKNEAIRQSARACLGCLPSVLVQIVEEYRQEFVDFEYFRSVLPAERLPEGTRPLFQSILLMTIETDNFELFDGFNTYYRMTWRYIMEDDYFTEFGEFVDISGRQMNSFRGAMRNIIHYLGRGGRWVNSIRFGPGSPRTNILYTLMGSGPIDKVKKALKRASAFDFYSREELLAIAMGSQKGSFFGKSDANPEIIEFILNGSF